MVAGRELRPGDAQRERQPVARGDERLGRLRFGAQPFVADERREQPQRDVLLEHVELDAGRAGQAGEPRP